MYIYTYHVFFIHSFTHGHLGCFHVLAIADNAAMIHVPSSSPYFSHTQENILPISFYMHKHFFHMLIKFSFFCDSFLDH